MEVFPLNAHLRGPQGRLLHVRGGVSKLVERHNEALEVFSTFVEVFLVGRFSESRPSSLLHVRGGVSCIDGLRYALSESSPRSWRCFHDKTPSPKSGCVFSTFVEVFLVIAAKDRFCERLLHVRGGVSEYWKEIVGLAVVFSTSVEVFPRKA